MDGKKAIRALHSCFQAVYGKGDYQMEIFYQKKSCDEGTPDWDDFENYVWDDEEGSANEEDIVISASLINDMKTYMNENTFKEIVIALADHFKQGTTLEDEALDSVPRRKR